MKHYALLYFSTLIVMVLLDMAWISGIAREFYKGRIDALEFHAIPALLFYLMYAAGIVVFTNSAAGANWQTTLVYGALFGLVAYGTYDLTNLATLRGWSAQLVIVDMLWGMSVSAVSSTAGLLITQYFRL